MIRNFFLPLLIWYKIASGSHLENKSNKISDPFLRISPKQEQIPYPETPTLYGSLNNDPFYTHHPVPKIHYIEDTIHEDYLRNRVQPRTNQEKYFCACQGASCTTILVVLGYLIFH